MKKNPHGRIIKGKPKEQYLNTISERRGEKKKYYQIYWGTKKKIFYISQWLKEHGNKN